MGYVKVRGIENLKVMIEKMYAKKLNLFESQLILSVEPTLFI